MSRRWSGIRRARRSGAAGRFTPRSSAPYLTAATGRTWRTLDELEPLLRGGARRSQRRFSHARWVLEHMTDAICAWTLYALIQDGAAGRG